MTDALYLLPIPRQIIETERHQIGMSGFMDDCSGIFSQKPLVLSGFQLTPIGLNLNEIDFAITGIGIGPFSVVILAWGMLSL
jgi:hypothetical protein